MDKINVLSDMFADLIGFLKDAVAMIKEFIGGISIKYGWQLEEPEEAEGE